MFTAKLGTDAPIYPLFWQRCIDHSRVKGGKRYHPQQIFYLSVLPKFNVDKKLFTHPTLHDEVEKYSKKDWDKDENNAYSAKMLEYYAANIGNYTRIIFPLFETSNIDVLGGKDRQSIYYNTYLRPDAADNKDKRFAKLDDSSPLRDFPQYSSKTYYCFTVMNEQNYDVMLQPCDLTGIDRRQWFFTIKGETPGAHGYLASTIGKISKVNSVFIN